MRSHVDGVVGPPRCSWIHISSRTLVVRVSPLLAEVGPIPEATFGVTAESGHSRLDSLISGSSLRKSFQRSTLRILLSKGLAAIGGTSYVVYNRMNSLVMVHGPWPGDCRLGDGADGALRQFALLRDRGPRSS